MKWIWWDFYIKFSTLTGMYYIFSSNLGWWTHSYCVHTINDDFLWEKRWCIITINIHNTYLAYISTNTIFIEILEKKKFCFNIIFHSFMEIKMILTDICEDSNIIPDTIYSIIKKSMTGCFYNSIFTSLWFCLFQKFPKNKRTRRSHFEVIFTHFSIYHHVYSGKHSNFFSSLLKTMCNNIGRGCFSLCSCNSDNHHIFQRVSWHPKSNHATKRMIGCTNRWVKGYKFAKKRKHKREKHEWLEFYEKIAIIQTKKLFSLAYYG